jgi:hypothetical protein
VTTEVELARRTHGKDADPMTAPCPPGHLRCLRCRWPFPTADRLRNRICAECAVKNQALSRLDVADSMGGNRIALPRRMWPYYR